MPGLETEHIMACTCCDNARAAALGIYHKALDGVRADDLVGRQLVRTGSVLHVGEHSISLGGHGKLIVVGAGKAAVGMAQAVAGAAGDAIAAGVVVTKHGHGGCAGSIRVLEAGHPVPDRSSVEAGAEIARLASEAGRHDTVVCLLSGGASALMELPVDGLTLEDLRDVTSRLLRAGAPIRDLNRVRACLSMLKAGGLARLAAPARVVTLVVSDVLGNPLDVIASGPCMPVELDPVAALEVLARYGVDGSAAESVLRRRAAGPAVERARSDVDHVIVGDIWTALDAAGSAARGLGFRCAILSGSIEGEARAVGRTVGAIARDLPRLARAGGPDCLVLGGETIVTVTGDGLGGRSQELAAAAAEAMAGASGVAVLAGGTDGTDGPTDAAGGVVCGHTSECASRAGYPMQDALVRNDTYRCLERIGALVVTGPTNSNVGDLIIIVASPPDQADTH